MISDDMYSLIEELFPICRSITGNGVRQTLNILQRVIPIYVVEVPSGTQVFDWTVPQEWNIKGAFIKDSEGGTIVDFADSNLHVVGYSEPVDKKMSLVDLKDHIISLPEHPDWIPYATSYYERTWGFCIQHNKFKDLKDDLYHVKIDSNFTMGSLTYGEFIIKGETDKEILISANICHPSMANNELSGPVLISYLAKYLQTLKHKRFTYRFVFVPETIGSITYIYNNLDKLRENVIAGYTVSCVGDDGDFSYLKSKDDDSLTNRITLHVLRHSEETFRTHEYTERGSDERQYGFPGVNLPIGSLMRTRYYDYDEYHTSADNLDFISQDALFKSLEKYKLCIEAFECNIKYVATTICEPQLGKLGLYPSLSDRNSILYVKDMKNIIAYSDGKHDLLEISNRINKPIWEIASIARTLEDKGVIRKVCDVK